MPTNWTPGPALGSTYDSADLKWSQRLGPHAADLVSVVGRTRPKLYAAQEEVGIWRDTAGANQTTQPNRHGHICTTRPRNDRAPASTEHHRDEVRAGPAQTAYDD
jgi:hypothetical protein